jgi:hypothetical protein
MAMWLYQLDNADWSVNEYRLDVWEGERWEWRVGRAAGLKISPPKPGDKVVFFYAPTNCEEPGFYGWAIITLWIDDQEKKDRRCYFRPVVPSDHLKMRPWWDEEAKSIADVIRGPAKQGTLWPVSDTTLENRIGSGISRWLNGPILGGSGH